MLRNAIATFLILSSLGCATGSVLVTNCVLGIEEQQGHCAPPKPVPSYSLPLAEMNNYTCVHPDEWAYLMTWIKRYRKGTE